MENPEPVVLPSVILTSNFSSSQSNASPFTLPPSQLHVASFETHPSEDPILVENLGQSESTHFHGRDTVQQDTVVLVCNFDTRISPYVLKFLLANLEKVDIPAFNSGELPPIFKDLQDKDKLGEILLVDQIEKLKRLDDDTRNEKLQNDLKDQIKHEDEVEDEEDEEEEKRSNLVRSKLEITSEEAKEEKKNAICNSYQYFKVKIADKTTYTIHEAASRVFGALFRKGTYFSHLFWYVIFPQHYDEAYEMVEKDDTLAKYASNSKDRKDLRLLHGVCRCLIGMRKGGSTDISEEQRQNPSWITLCEQAGLDPKIATKWAVGGKLYIFFQSLFV